MANFLHQTMPSSSRIRLTILVSLAVAFIIAGTATISYVPNDLSIAIGLSSFLVIILLSIAYIGHSQVAFWLGIGFAARAAFTLANFHFEFIEQRIARAIFDEAGTYILSRWHAGAIPSIDEIKGGLPIYSYGTFIASIYSLLGRQPAAILVVNAFLDVCAIYIIYRITLLIFGKRSATFVLFIELISPYSFWMNGTFLRESIVRLFTVLLLLNIAKLMDERSDKTQYIAWSLSCIIAITLLRPENLPMFVMLGGVVWYFGSGAYRSVEKSTLLLIVVAPALIGGILYIMQYAEFLFRFDWSASPEFFEDFRAARDHGNAVYLAHVSYSTWWQVILYLPLRFFYFMYVPMPWHVKSAQIAFAFMDTLLYLGLTLMTIRYFVKNKLDLANWKHRFVVLLLIYVVVGASAFAVVDSNIGAALRHRRPFVFGITLLASGLYATPVVQRVIVSFNRVPNYSVATESR